MIDLTEEKNPPLHLILGSDAVGLLKKAEETKKAEFEKWMDVSLSTDHDDAVNFLKTEEGKMLASLK